MRTMVASTKFVYLVYQMFMPHRNNGVSIIISKDHKLVNI